MFLIRSHFVCISVSGALRQAVTTCGAQVIVIAVVVVVIGPSIITFQFVRKPLLFLSRQLFGSKSAVCQKLGNDDNENSFSFFSGHSINTAGGFAS